MLFFERQLFMLLLGIVVGLSATVHALDNGLARKPPMGWVSWERFTCELDCKEFPDQCINEDLFKQMADRLKEDDYSKVGYKYINIDDCWSEKKRSETNENLLPDKQRFPKGLNALADYIHGKELKFGIYGDCGTATCAGYPAQLKSSSHLEENYFDLDAQQFAQWGVDSLKFDGCNLEPNKQESICPNMANSLSLTGRPMVLICEHPFYMLRAGLPVNWTLAAQACNTWRYFEDVEDSWLSVLSIIDFSIKMQKDIFKVHGPGQWFDPDQLVIGNYGLSLDQARAQMAIWCVWSAPLYMGNDLRSIEPDMAKVLKNELLIREVNQDNLGLFGLMVAEQQNGQLQAFVKPVEPIKFGCPSFVVVYLNRATLGNTRLVSFQLRELLLKMPLEFVSRRQDEVYEGRIEPARKILPDRCKQMIKNAMTKPRIEIPEGLVPKGKGRETSIEEKQVELIVLDLFGDPLSGTRIGLNSALSLRVNPSGVRAVKIVPSKYE